MPPIKRTRRNKPKFEDYQMMIKKVAHKKHTQFPSIEFDELVGRGGLLFVEAIQKFDCTKGSFSSFFWMVLNHKMVTWERGHGRRYQPQLGIEDDAASMEITGGFDIARFVEFKESIERLGKEAKDVLKVLFSCPYEILEGSTPGVKIEILKRKLISVGRKKRNISKGIKDIKKILKN